MSYAKTSKWELSEILLFGKLLKGKIMVEKKKMHFLLLPKMFSKAFSIRFFDYLIIVDLLLIYLTVCIILNARDGPYMERNKILYSILSAEVSKNEK